MIDQQNFCRSEKFDNRRANGQFNLCERPGIFASYIFILGVADCIVGKSENNQKKDAGSAYLLVDCLISILWSMSNRYLRVLFVQAAAWVVLDRPKSWERHGLKSWIETAKSGCCIMCWRLRWPTNWPGSPGAFLRMDAPSKRANRPAEAIT